jgi:hypothetical protein
MAGSVVAILDPNGAEVPTGELGRIFVGNADGVLIFDGAFWEKVALPNGDLVRSLAHDGNGRIYVGGYDAFGWIERGPTGRFVYHELSDRYAEVLGGELFADIRHIGIGAESVWFVGLEHLFRFDPDTGATGLVRHDGRFGPIARYRDEMVLQFRGEGLKVHRAGRWELLMGGAPARSLLTGLVSMPDDTLLVVGRHAEDAREKLEAIFRGAGWNVIKVVWGSYWDPLLAKDSDGLLRQRMDEAVDGEYQTFKSKDGAYVRENFFGKYEKLKEMVSNMSDEDVWRLNRGGHDPHKVYAAYAAATKHTGQPTVILAKMSSKA